MKNRKGSGRTKRIIPQHVSRQAILRETLLASGAEAECEECEESEESSTAIPVIEGGSLAAAAAETKLYPKMLPAAAATKAEKDGSEDDKGDGLIAVMPDEFSAGNGITGDALHRDRTLREYFCFPMNDIRTEALSRLMKNTKCVRADGMGGMLHAISLDIDGTKLDIFFDRYSEMVSIMGREEPSAAYDKCAQAVISYLAESGVIKDYAPSCTMFLKGDAETDPLATVPSGYPAIWFSGAAPDDVANARKLAEWYKGMYRIYVTPSSAGIYERTVQAVNILGSDKRLTVRLSGADESQSLFIAKAVADADRFYRSSVNMTSAMTARNYDESLISSEGADITRIPLFRKPKITDGKGVRGPFMTDIEAFGELMSATNEGIASVREVEELQKKIEELKAESESERKKHMKDLEEFTAKIDEAKEESKQACEKVLNDLKDFTEKLCETEKEKKALEDKVAEYAGLLRDQKETDEYEQILRSSEEENADLRRKCAELEAANEALKCNLEALKRKDVKGETLICRGSEKDYFVGEVKDFILSAVAREIEASQPGTRRYHVLKDVLDFNGYERLLEAKKSRLKAICRDYDGNLSEALPELEKEGYYVKSTSGHPKIEYYGDPRYTSVVSRTPSDYSSGMNQISDIATACF